MSGVVRERSQPEISHVLFSISKLVCHTEQKATLKHFFFLQFCDTFIFRTHQKRQCVIQDLSSAIDEGIESL